MAHIFQMGGEKPPTRSSKLGLDRGHENQTRQICGNVEGFLLDSLFLVVLFGLNNIMIPV